MIGCPPWLRPLPAHTTASMFAHAHHCFRSGVSASSAAARSFSPLCFTDSGFNSDSTQYPADGASPEQVSSPGGLSPPHTPSTAGVPSVYDPGLRPPPPRFSHVSFRLVPRDRRYVWLHGAERWCMAAPGPADAHRRWRLSGHRNGASNPWFSRLAAPTEASQQPPRCLSRHV